jgi:tyrosyl-tRNA synthetase
MDFLNLYRDYGVTLQFGGSDQWGNITAGVDLIRRATGETVHAFVTPLITKPDGTKYGKTEGGALWLSAEMMSPYAFHQFWLNVDDAQVGGMLRSFSELSHEQIEALEADTREKPWLRSGQKQLADELTTLVHGAAETAHAKDAAAALFGGGDLHELSPTTLAAALREAGSASVPALTPVVDLLVATGLAKSKGEARRTIAEGGAYLNNVRIEDAEAMPQPTDLIAGSWLVLRRGKKQFAGVEVG